MSETDLAGCDEATFSRSAGTAGGITVTLAAGETTTCTITNTKQPRSDVNKVVVVVSSPQFDPDRINGGSAPQLRDGG